MSDVGGAQKRGRMIHRETAAAAFAEILAVAAERKGPWVAMATSAWSAEPQAKGLSLADLQRRIVMGTCLTYEWNRMAAARELGVSYRTLHYWLSVYRADGAPIPDGRGFSWRAGKRKA